MTSQKKLKIFKIAYQWYEGEYYENLLGKDVSSEEFEKDLIKAKDFAESLIGKEIKKGEYLGKGYRVECLPEYYAQIIWYLETKCGYIDCDYNEDIKYYVNDLFDKEIQISKSTKKVEYVDLNELIIKRSDEK